MATGTAEPPGSDQQPEEAPPAPLLRLRDGLPGPTDTPEALRRVVDAVAAGSGPVALDAERASGYRYSARAYLVQLRRAGAGTALVDPIAFPDLAELGRAIGDAEWILHAASQDLPCLREIGLRPVSLFDTELAARLLGYPRVGLATLVESIVGQSMRKEHSAADWSKRPLPTPWLEYAALDVEVLLELREVLGRELEDLAQLDQHLDVESGVGEPGDSATGASTVNGGVLLAHRMPSDAAPPVSPSRPGDNRAGWPRARCRRATGRKPISAQAGKILAGGMEDPLGIGDRSGSS